MVVLAENLAAFAALVVINVQTVQGDVEAGGSGSVLAFLNHLGVIVMQKLVEGSGIVEFGWEGVDNFVPASGAKFCSASIG